MTVHLSYKTKGYNLDGSRAPSFSIFLYLVPFFIMRNAFNWHEIHLK